MALLPSQTPGVAHRVACRPFGGYAPCPRPWRAVQARATEEAVEVCQPPIHTVSIPAAQTAWHALVTSQCVQVKPAVKNQQAAMAALASIQGAAGADTAGLAAAVTREVLLADPETAKQLERYQAAMARVEAAKAAAAELEDIFKQAGKDAAAADAQDEANRRRKASEVMANAEVAAAEKLLAAAQLEAAQVAQLQARLAEEATQDVERAESVKAGAVATIGGLLSALPILLTDGSSGITAALTLATTLGSCFLFGVTYRYAVRLDVHNSHLRSGAVGAFGLVRAAAAGDVLQANSALGPFDIDTVVGPAALYTGQSMILFAFSAWAVELAFKQGWVKRFGELALPVVDKSKEPST